MEQQHLVVLDLDGTLCRRFRISPGESVHHDFREGYNAAVFRPGYDKFLLALFERYKVAVLTSTTEKNAKPIIEAMFTRKQYQELKFIWFRDHTHYDSHSSERFATLKNLSDIYDNPIANSDRSWSEANTIIVDDSMSKVRMNPVANILLIPSFTTDSDGGENVFDAVLEQLEEKFSLLSAHSI